MAKQKISDYQSIKLLMVDALPHETPEDLIRRKCRELVAWAKSLSWSGPPYEPKILASLMGIRVEGTTEEILGEGRIFPLRDKRVLIQYRLDSLPVRQRFTICHELAHTCFPDCFKKIRLQSCADLSEEEKYIEKLCDIGASELLMPYHDFLDDLKNQSVGADLVENLSRKYLSSIDATVRRAIELSKQSVCAAFLRNSSGSAQSKTLLEVQYVIRGAEFELFIHPRTKVPTKSVANLCLSTKQTQRSNGREFWFVSGQMRSWQVDAIKLPDIPHPSYAKVLAILKT